MVLNFLERGLSETEAPCRPSRSRGSLCGRTLEAPGEQP